MLHLIPPPAHRSALRLAHALRVGWWRIRKPRLAGCRVLAFDADGRLLLVRHSYGSGAWMPPGGGLARGEDAVAAACRELLEETACALHEAMLLDRVTEPLHGAGNQVHIVVGTTRDQPLADGREIVEAAFFACDDLPEPMPGRLRWQIEQWITAARAARHRDGEEPPSGHPGQRG